MRIPVAVLMFFGALGLRLIGLEWGLPNLHRYHSLHPDELFIWYYAQQIEPSKAAFLPGFYNYGTFYLTLLKLCFDGADALMPSLAPEGVLQGPQAASIAFHHWVGRLMSAAAGALTAVALLVGLARHGRTLAWGASVALLLAPGHLVHSRFQTVDVVATLLLTLGLLGATRLLECSEKRVYPWTVVSALFFGLAAGCKYGHALALVALVVALVLRLGRNIIGPLAAAALTAILVFVAAVPATLLETGAFLASLRFEAKHVASGHGIHFTATEPTLLYQIQNMGEGMGWGFLVLGCCGLLMGALRRKPEVWVLGAFGVAYLLMISTQEVKFFRYALPLFPVLAMGVGLGTEALWKRHTAMAVGVFALCMGEAIQRDLQWTQFMVQPDPRDQAGAWLRNNANPTTVVGLSHMPWYWTPTVFGDVMGPRPFDEPEQRAMGQARQPRVVYPFGPGARRYRDYRRWEVKVFDHEPDFVALTSFQTTPAARLLDFEGELQEHEAAIRDAFEAFDGQLRRDYELVQSFGHAGMRVHDLEYIQPTVQIWARRGP